MPDPALIKTVDSLAAIFTSTVAFLRDNAGTISGDEPTDCPGWSVKDQVSHMVGLEQVLAGAPMPSCELPPLPHVDGEFDEYMEVPVQARRSLPLVSVIDELAGMSARRISQYQQLIDRADGEEETLVPAPMGQSRPLASALTRRVFDLWTHEQDIRRACGHSIREADQFASKLMIDSIFGAWSKQLSEEVSQDGTLRISVAGEAASDIEFLFGDGGPVAVLGLNLTELYRLGCGRGSTDEVLQGATVAGARDLLDTVVPHLKITP